MCFFKFNGNFDTDDYCDLGILKELEGKVIVNLEIKKERDDFDKIIFITRDNEKFEMLHSQGCCEYFYLGEISGNMNNLIYSKVLQVETTFEFAYVEGISDYNNYDYYVYFNFITEKGEVIFKWYLKDNDSYCRDCNFYIAVNKV